MPFDVLPSTDLIDRTLGIENSYTISRMQVLESLPGNPVGIAFRHVGGTAIGMMAKHFPNPNFNKIVGLRGGEEGEIAPLVAWCREHGVTPRFEILPREGDAGLTRELARLGFFASSFHTSLVRDTSPIAKAARSGDVEQVTTPEILEQFLEAYCAGWGVPDSEGFKRNVRPWLGRKGWSLFLAREDGRPAATAILYIEDKTAYLADASCDPAFRRRGLQLALLERRINAAIAAGVDFICSGAAFQSGSHRNMERAGMRIQFVRSIWTEREVT
jgi:ribosomal protein S18 acetylase RimI-like enzyme